MFTKRRPLAERFWEKVDKNGPVHPVIGTRCWMWTAGHDDKGYGTIGSGGTGNVRKTNRVSWELNIGPIPDGLCVLHRCDNPPCVNPAHLFLGTHSDNARDRNTKGRHWQARVTNCPRGHPLSGDNLRVVRNKKAGGSHQRACKACVREARRRYLARQAANRAEMVA